MSFCGRWIWGCVCVCVTSRSDKGVLSPSGRCCSRARTMQFAMMVVRIIHSNGVEPGVKVNKAKKKQKQSSQTSPHPHPPHTHTHYTHVHWCSFRKLKNTSRDNTVNRARASVYSSFYRQWTGTKTVKHQRHVRDFCRYPRCRYFPNTSFPISISTDTDGVYMVAWWLKKVSSLCYCVTEWQKLSDFFHEIT